MDSRRTGAQSQQYSFNPKSKTNGRKGAHRGTASPGVSFFHHRISHLRLSHSSDWNFNLIYIL